MKLDTQGFEMEVLRGSEKIIEKIDVIQLEVSFRPLYEGAPYFDELWLYLKNRGFAISAVEPGFTFNKTGEMLQADFTFVRVI